VLSFLEISEKSDFCLTERARTMVFTLLKNLTYILTSALTVRFDGSLRYPSDPGFPVNTLGRLSACAVSLHNCKEQNILGGRLLNANVLTTSAEAEYEGILLGLEGLMDLYQGRLKQIAAPPSGATIMFEGDCKTVINQLRRKARPRKLQRYFDEAISIIEKIPWKIEFRHIPRTENLLCDRLCGKILSDHEAGYYSLVRQELATLTQFFEEERKSAESGKFETLLQMFLNRHFSEGRSLIPYSKRPKLYRNIAKVACERRDFLALIRVGQLLEIEARTVWPSILQAIDKNSNIECEVLSTGAPAIGVECVDDDTLLVEGVVYQLVGQRSLGMGDFKEVLRQQRRHRNLLQRLDLHVTAVEQRLNEWTTPNLTAEDETQATNVDIDVHSHLLEEFPLDVIDWCERASESEGWYDTGTFWHISGT
jgi:ribonuclease HI